MFNFIMVAWTGKDRWSEAAYFALYLIGKQIFDLSSNLI